MYCCTFLATLDVGISRTDGRLTADPSVWDTTGTLSVVLAGSAAVAAATGANWNGVSVGVGSMAAAELDAMKGGVAVEFTRDVSAANDERCVLARSAIVWHRLFRHDGTNHVHSLPRR